LERNNALADAQSAYANLLVSVGIDLMPGDIETQDLNMMTGRVNDALNRLNQGGIESLINKPLNDQQDYVAPKTEDILFSDDSL